MRGSADRLLAARLLVRVEGGAYASRLLAGSVSRGVRARVLGVLRWQRTLDETIAPLCRRPLPDLDPEVRAALRLGLHEATRLGVPPQVATDAAVHLVRRLAKGSAAGMVNAVLRRAVCRHEKTIADAPADLRLSHPEWLCRRWVSAFGEAAAESILAVNQTPAAPWVWFVDDGDRDRLESAGAVLRPHPWCPGAWTAPGAEAELLRVVRRGGAYVQDPASQLVAHLAAGLTGDRPMVVDLCAAPGGKLALLGRLRPWRRACAVDLHLQRARLASGLLERLDLAGPGSNAPVVCADARRPPVPAASWDLVLVDAPCTGTGTLRRHPDLRWRLLPESIAEMAELQAALLATALDLVAPDGVVLYSTCSIEAEENEGLVVGLDGGCIDLGPLLPPDVPWRPTAAGGARILPCDDGDGFTLHALRGLASVGRAR